MKKIVLATDGSPSAVRATGQAIELASSTGAELDVVTVWSIPTSRFGYGLVVAPEIAEDERLRAESILDEAVEAAEAAGVQAERILRQGEAATEICAVAEAIHADVIVVGSHGWNPLRRVFLGSVSSRVLHHAACPVLVVRGDFEPDVEDADPDPTRAVAAR